MREERGKRCKSVIVWGRKLQRHLEIVHCLESKLLYNRTLLESNLVEVSVHCLESKLQA